MAKLQEELEVMKPMLEEAVQESITTMEQIEVDSVSTVKYVTITIYLEKAPILIAGLS